ncbi:MAG: TolC family protein [Candidatus Aminicenantes bacterium]|nr:TolC family protein [Candidatus Aminicenantes bacterium]
MSNAHPSFKKKRRLTQILIIGLLLGPSLLIAQDDILSLEKAIQLALNRNERAIQATERITAADARVMRARASFLPVLNATGNYTRRPFEVSRIIGNQIFIVQSYNALSGAARLSMTLFNSSNIPTLRQANLDKISEESTAADSKRKLTFEVSNAFIATLGVDQVLEASKHRFDYAKQALDAAKARYAAGLVSVNDVTRAELEYATAEMGITQVSGQRETTWLQLSYLLDDETILQKKLLPPEFLLKAAAESSSTLEQLIAAAQDRRPDLNSLRWHAKAQHALVLDPSLRYLPSLTFTGQYTYTNEAGLTGKNTNWNVGLSLSWPIFDGFTRNADYQERRATAYMADLDVKSTERKVDLDVRGAFVTLNSARASLKLANVAYDVAKRNAAETAELYRQGLSQALQVADANVRLFEAEVGLVQSRYNLGIAYLNLEAALGLDPFGKEPTLVY